MGWRRVCALGLAALLAGCAEMPELSGLADFAMAAPEPVATAKPQADPSFRMGELKAGLTKAQLEEMYPNRLVFDSGDSRNELYFVEPPGVAPGATVTRDRLVLWLNDGRLATFDVARSNEAAGVAIATLQPTAQTAPSARQPVGRFGVQIAARRSEADARAAIEQMRAKYPSQLGREWATIHRVSLPQGVFYRVVVGPIGSAQQAAQLCSSLKAQGAECFIRGT